MKAALVVTRLMRGDHEIEPPDPGRTQPPVDTRLRRTAVEQGGRTGAVLDQGGVPLADVEEADGERVGRRRRGEHGARAKDEDPRDQRDRPSTERTRPSTPGSGELEGAHAREAASSEVHGQARSSGGRHCARMPPARGRVASQPGAVRERRHRCVRRHHRGC